MVMGMHSSDEVLVLMQRSFTPSAPFCSITLTLRFETPGLSQIVPTYNKGGQLRLRCGLPHFVRGDYLAPVTLGFGRFMLTAQ